MTEQEQKALQQLVAFMTFFDLKAVPDEIELNQDRFNKGVKSRVAEAVKILGGYDNAKASVKEFLQSSKEDSVLEKRSKAIKDLIEWWYVNGLTEFPSVLEVEDNNVQLIRDAINMLGSWKQAKETAEDFIKSENLPSNKESAIKFLISFMKNFELAGLPLEPDLIKDEDERYRYNLSILILGGYKSARDSIEEFLRSKLH